MFIQLQKPLHNLGKHLQFPFREGKGKVPAMHHLGIILDKTVSLT